MVAKKAKTEQRGVSHEKCEASNRFVLVGTYKGDQLTRWRGWYNYPITDDDKINEVDAAKIKELWLFNGTKDERRYKAEFVGVKTRKELINDYGYPAKGKAHGEKYLLFKTQLLYQHKNSVPEDAERVIVRAADFAKRSPKIARQLKAYLESPDRNDPDLAKRLPEIITRLRPDQLRVCEAAVQLSLFPGIDSFPQSSVKEVSKPVEAMSFSLIHHLTSIDQRKREYPSISLFSGAMGLDIGLGQSGIDIRIGQDFDRSCVETMLANVKSLMNGGGQWTRKAA